MNSRQIRQSFLDYFKKNGHRIVPSSPVVPIDDPTLLFTNAGMVQFKNTFLGLEKRDYTRAASSQKCIRAGGKHNDLDNVGFTARHQTFFEMLGNFSFGDYFKEDAIHYAWEYVTKTLGLNPKKLYATVFTEDDDAERLWKKIAPELGERVLRFGVKDNFWAMGETGPCGPCSEIHYDRGPEVPGELNGEGDRFMEIWNLVFMQFDRYESGDTKPLPRPSVDTGAGLERLSMVLQNVDSNYSTDLFTPLIAKVVKLSGREYDPGPAGVPHRVIADHVRALAFALADNAGISNEGRGYVLRRILRRAARYGHQLGLDEPFIYKIVQPLSDYMADVYPEIKAQRGHIELVIKTEEEQFDRTLTTGIGRFEDIIKAIQAKGGKVIPGEDVFKLYDTYGFPADLTEIMAHEKQLEIDWDGFNRELEQQRERSKGENKFKTIISETEVKIERSPDVKPFVGYEVEIAETKILQAKSIDNDYELILLQTPFYAESGGQVADEGFIFSNDFKIHVTDTKRIGEEIIHFGDIINGDISDGYLGNVTAEIDHARRADIRRNHTATHLLHKALRMTLGDHVFQQGSLVAPDRLRFDFSHFKAMTEDELQAVEKIVNDKIKADLPVKTPENDDSLKNLTLEKARQMGAMALFGEKYGETVRVVKTGDFTMELCGGTHVNNTADIGRFFITSESAIAAGTRRIEAITGTKADEFFQAQAEMIGELKKCLAIAPEKADEETLTAIRNLQNDIHPRLLAMGMIDVKLNDYLGHVKKIEREKFKSVQKEISQEAAGKEPDLILQSADGEVVIFKLDPSSPADMMAFVDRFKVSYPDKTVLTLSTTDGKFAITSNAPESASLVLKIMAEAAGARGGGKPTIRGAMPADKIETAINALRGKSL